ncbi:MAG: hypothetical protein ACKVQR_12700 [Aquabacterium sp.]
MSKPYTASMTPRVVAIGFSLMVTLFTLGGIDALALRQHATQDLMASQPAGSPAVARTDASDACTVC